MAGQVAQLLDRLVRRELALIANQVDGKIARAFTEAGRSEHRPLGTVTIARALIAARRGGVTRERLLAVAAAVEGFVLALYENDLTLREAWAAECREQAEADIAQAAVFPESSAARLDSAIEATIEELAAKRSLLAKLVSARLAGEQR